MENLRKQKFVTVKDFNGVTFQVKLDDAKYISGEYVHISSKDINVMFNDTIFKCKPNHPNVLSGKYIRIIGKKKKYINPSNNHIDYLFKEDKLVKNKTYIPILSFYKYIKDENGKINAVLKNDPILKNKQLIYNTTKYVYNCDIHGVQTNLIEYKRNKAKPIPEKYKIYCPKCKEYYLSKNYIPTAIDINNCHEFLDNFSFYSSLQYTEKYWNKIIPHFAKCVYYSTSLLDKDICFSDRIYAFKNNIINLPKCLDPQCDESTYFLKSTMGISEYCHNHMGIYSVSNIEHNLYNYAKTIYSGEIIQSYRELGKEIDIYIPDLNLGIEFNGLYWHSDLFKDKNYHYDKLSFFNNNIKLITIWEDDWKYKQDLVKSMIKNQLGLNSNKIYARKTIIKNVDYNISKVFLDNNHIQGNCISAIKLGLYYGDELVSLMTFGKRNIGNKSQFELLRFCSKQNTTVIGGASKLFKHFITNYNPSEVVSYANLDISNGNIYETLGFNNQGHTGVNYWWVKDKRYHRSNFMKHKLVKAGADISKTENEIMRVSNYNKIYGNGNIKYVWTNINIKA